MPSYINSRSGKPAEEPKQERRYVEKVVNRPEVTDTFENGALWIRSSEDKPDLLNIDITLKPGTYKFVEGDTLRLIGFFNDRKPEGSAQPDYNLRIKKQKES